MSSGTWMDFDDFEDDNSWEEDRRSKRRQDREDERVMRKRMAQQRQVVAKRMKARNIRFEDE